MKHTAGLTLLAAALAVCVPRTILSHETLTTTVLFDREIVRVLDRHCVMCHAEKSLSFPLETWEQTWVQGRKIRADVIARHMPPWAAFPGYGQFANDNSLTLRESQFVVSWVEGLGPRNAGKVFLNVQDSGAAKPPAVRAHAHVDAWQLGTPDLVRPLPPTAVEPNQGDDVKRITVDLGLTTERRVRALEFMPGDRRVVRAAFFTLQETGQWLGSWTPWYGFMRLPDSVAFRLPAGSHIVAEIHYRSGSERVIDRGAIGLFLDRKIGSTTASDLVLDATGELPAGAAAHKLSAGTRLPTEASAIALRPEIDAAVTSIEVSATAPNGARQVLLFAKYIPVEWPTAYVFKKPVQIAAGSRLTVTAYAANPSSAPRTGKVRLTIISSKRRPS